MITYFCIYLALLFLCICKKNKSNGKSILFFIFCLLYFISAMRFDIGRDYDTYIKMYEFGDIDTHEYGFMVLMDFFRANKIPLQILISLYSGITLIFAFLFFFENSKNNLLSIFIFFCFTPFYFNSLNTFRQQTAIYICLYATRFIKNKKMLIYFGYVFSSAFFAHTSALLFIPLYYVLKKNVSQKIKIFILLIFMLSGSFMIKLFLLTPYAHYLEFTSNSGKIPILLFVEILICSFLFLSYKSHNNFILANINFLAVSCLFFMLINKNNPLFLIFSRLNEYFLPVVCILIPNYIDEEKKIYRYIFSNLCLLFFSAIFFGSMMLHGEENQLVPYKTIVQYISVDSLLDSVIFTISLLIFCFLKFINVKMDNKL